MVKWLLIPTPMLYCVHNLLLIGPPGGGKTMLAKRIPAIMPDLTLDEAMEVTKIHSVTGTLLSSNGIMRIRLFRSPHCNSRAHNKYFTIL